MKDTPGRAKRPNGEERSSKAAARVKRGFVPRNAAIFGWKLPAAIGLATGAVLACIAAHERASKGHTPSLLSPALAHLSARADKAFDTANGGTAVAGTNAPEDSPDEDALIRPPLPRGIVVRVPKGAQPAVEFAPRRLLDAEAGTYWAIAGLTLAEGHEKLPRHWALFADQEGRLQATGSPTDRARSSQRSFDPSVALQWHAFGWPSLLVDRFPLSLDQNIPGLRALHGEEFASWALARDLVPLERAGEIAPSCPAHQPATLHVNRLWEAFERNESGGGLVLLHDGPIDVRHQDLEGQVVDLGSEQAAGVFSAVSVSARTLPGDGRPVLGGLLAIHGTHVAGLMAARRNDFGVTGVAPGLRIESLALRGSGTGFGVPLSEVIEGLGRLERRVAERERLPEEMRKARGSGQTTIVSLGYAFDFGGAQSTARGTPLRDAIDAILRHDVVVVVPAGNSAFANRDAASLPAALAALVEGARGILLPVSASGLCSERTWYSRIAPLASGVQVFAPGERIYSTLPGTDYGSLSGTSQAAAQVAAVLAVGAHAAPSLSGRALVSLLLRSAQPLPSIAELAVMPDAWTFVQEVGDTERKRALRVAPGAK